MQLSILKIILYILIPFAPLYARVTDLNGSLDHAWTMFPVFNIFPFSIVPILMMNFNVIKKGKGNNIPYDNFMWIPIIFRFIAGIIVTMIVKNPLMKTILVLLLSILSIMTPNLIRRNRLCENKNEDNNNKDNNNKDNKDKDNEIPFNIMDGKQWYRSFVDSLFELGFGEIFPVMVMFIPFIGIGFRFIGMIPGIGKFVNDIIWCCGFVCGYVIINMYNQDDMKEMCYPNKFNTVNEIIRLVIGIICLLIGGFFSAKNKLTGFGKII
jgi:hypothetical protein